MFWKKKIEPKKQTWICGYSSTPDPATQYGKWGHAFDTKEEAEDIETKELSQNQFIYPLNRAKNKTVSKEHLKCLTELRSKYRK